MKLNRRNFITSTLATIAAAATRKWPAINWPGPVRRAAEVKESGQMITTLCTHDSKKWVPVGTLADIGGNLDSYRRDFTLSEWDAHHVDRLINTPGTTAYRLRHKMPEMYDIMYTFNAQWYALEIAGSESDGVRVVLTLHLESQPTGPVRWTE